MLPLDNENIPFWFYLLLKGGIVDMSWKDALEGIEEFSQKKEEKESHISQDRSRVAIEPKSDESLLAKFSPMVKEVYKYFAYKTGSRYQDEKVGSSEISSIFEIASHEGADDFKRVNVFPVVHMTAWGILVEAPLRSEGAARRCFTGLFGALAAVWIAFPANHANLMGLSERVLAALNLFGWSPAVPL
jgi:hypothetical protein